mmetsp:Transcript_16059/g.19506  ORF Transcript_16059/g.19506 Transcript_16059/m.19506 type:complete len:300 (+) Transcript_16059:180-1079(+)
MGRLDGQVAIVTGAGQGLGRAYAHDLAANGAAVVVNDPGQRDGNSTAEIVVNEIVAAGGKAIANLDPIGADYSVAKKMVDQAIEKFGKLSIIVNNAGILRDRSFAKQTPAEWDAIYQVHMLGTRNLCKAAWEHMRAEKYGRIVNISSINGVRGAPGQSNYSAMKAGIIGFTKVLALEGKKRNILCNVVIPGAGTAMTATIMPKEVVEASDPKYVAPMVTYLVSPQNQATGRVFEAGIGFFAELQWRRAQGLFLDLEKPYNVDTIEQQFSTITDMTNATDPIEEDAGPIPKQLKQVLSKM